MLFKHTGENSGFTEKKQEDATLVKPPTATASLGMGQTCITCRPVNRTEDAERSRPPESHDLCLV